MSSVIEIALIKIHKMHSYIFMKIQFINTSSDNYKLFLKNKHLIHLKTQVPYDKEWIFKNNFDHQKNCRNH